MAHFPLTDCKILLAEFDISGDMNSVTLERSQAAIPDDFFAAGKTFNARLPGLSDGVAGLAGMVELTDNGQDEIFNSRFGLTNVPLLITLRGATDGFRSKFGVFQQGQYQSGGNVGGRAEWTADGRISNYELTDGLILATGAKTGTFNGTARELGAVSATQKLRAQIHAVSSIAFTSAVFKVQSSATEGGAYTTRATFTTIIAHTSEHIVTAGPFTDTWWRIICDSFTGTSLTVYGAVGIQ